MSFSKVFHQVAAVQRCKTDHCHKAKQSPDPYSPPSPVMWSHRWWRSPDSHHQSRTRHRGKTWRQNRCPNKSQSFETRSMPPQSQNWELPLPSGDWKYSIYQTLPLLRPYHRIQCVLDPPTGSSKVPDKKSLKSSVALAICFKISSSLQMARSILNRSPLKTWKVVASGCG